eukprot:106744-Ditylum_brightwellii.AAC.1
MQNLFNCKELEELTSGVEVKRSYRVEVSDNLNDRAVEYEKCLAENTALINIKEEEIDDCKEDHIEK